MIKFIKDIELSLGNQAAFLETPCWRQAGDTLEMSISVKCKFVKPDHPIIRCTENGLS
jgi:hypothetical protein